MAERPADPAQRDLAWAGYHPRAMAPTFAALLAGTVVVLTGRWYLEDLSELADRLGALAVFALTWAVWPGFLAVFLYRTVTFTYRLTDRSVLADFGMFARPVPPVPLTAVTGVVVGGGWLGRRLGVGWVEVRAGDRSVRLRGVRNPAAFVLKIRTAAESARKTG